MYSAYHQIVTIRISKNRNYLEEFSSLVVYLVDNFRKFILFGGRHCSENGTLSLSLKWASHKSHSQFFF